MFADTNQESSRRTTLKSSNRPETNDSRAESFTLTFPDRKDDATTTNTHHEIKKHHETNESVCKQSEYSITNEGRRRSGFVVDEKKDANPPIVDSAASLLTFSPEAFDLDSLDFC